MCNAAGLRLYTTVPLRLGLCKPRCLAALVHAESVRMLLICGTYHQVLVLSLTFHAAPALPSLANPRQYSTGTIPALDLPLPSAASTLLGRSSRHEYFR